MEKNAPRKNKRYKKEEILKALELSKISAARIIDDNALRDKQLEKLGEKLTDTVINIEGLDHLPVMIDVLRDVGDGRYKGISLESLIDVASAVAYVLSCKGISRSKAKLADVKESAVVNYVAKKNKKELDDYRSWEKWKKQGIYPIVPAVIIDEKEEKSIMALTERYEKLIAPTKFGKLTKKVGDIVPDKIKQMLEDAGHSIQGADLYEKVVSVAADGFDILVKTSAKVTISEKDVIKQINSTIDDNRIFGLEDICYVRGYDISKLVNKFRTQNIAVALAEGGSTGALGLAGLPLNLAASMFIFYRAVQSIAMFYGYDVKNSAEELEIATGVFMEAMDPQKGSGSEMGDMIAKVMTISESLVVKNTVQKGWAAMAERNGLTLLITQIRALAHASAKKALEAAGKKGLEPKLFEGILKALGKKLTQDAVEKAATPLAAVITALMDVSTMNKIVEYADIFYNKRFLAEKQVRIELCEDPSLAKDVDYEVMDN